MYCISSGRIRPALWKHFAFDPDFTIIRQAVAWKSYLNYLKQAKFCLIPRGREVGFNKGTSVHMLSEMTRGFIRKLGTYVVQNDENFTHISDFSLHFHVQCFPNVNS